MRRAPAVASTLALVLCLALAGCGGDNGDDVAPPAVTDTAPADTPPSGVDGEAVFASAGCGSCHTLAAAGSSGTIGPDLDETQPSAERVAEQVRNGAGAMPAFADDLSPEEIDAVADYVAAVAGT